MLRIETRGLDRIESNLGRVARNDALKTIVQKVSIIAENEA